MKEILSRTRAACEKYAMIESGSRIAVGVSGGKDSVMLLCALARLRDFYPVDFSLLALSIDPRFEGRDTDFSEIEKLCASLGVEYTIKRTSLYDIIFEQRREQNPCSLCARMRRGILCKTARELGCGTVALGHHSDDAAQTVLMNLTRQGRFAGLPAKSLLDRSGVTLIRPLIFCDERLIENRVRALGLPVVESGCPVNGSTERSRAQALIEYMSHDCPDIKAKLVGAAERMGKESADGGQLTPPRD